jgi:hypothetical protein
MALFYRTIVLLSRNKIIKVGKEQPARLFTLTPASIRMSALVNRDSSSRCKTGRGEQALSAIVSARGRGLLDGDGLCSRRAIRGINWSAPSEGRLSDSAALKKTHSYGWGFHADIYWRSALLGAVGMQRLYGDEAAGRKECRFIYGRDAQDVDAGGIRHASGDRNQERPNI